MENFKGRRVSGGSSWADAMFRFNANTQEYVKVMFKRVLRKNNIEENNYRIYFSNYDFLIMKNNQIVINASYNQVEEQRRVSPYTFEIWLQQDQIKNN
ncbi:MAG: hypothetical protein GX237_07260 [Clostridiales bacterium]|nr:hypothetical protein [Clostridiales bacterium]